MSYYYTTLPLLIITVAYWSKEEIKAVLHLNHFSTYLIGTTQYWHFTGGEYCRVIIVSANNELLFLAHIPAKSINSFLYFL